ncbi:hypothetical protein VP01_594g2 [Puccinia sorghi]|uniref:Uncharacterized protein n=1 Tax=Puccinia sorghi TaxID=27349 RepID=A0A0L6UJR2_9BASI|nr:hypothetical protein VP01_594g2 [Puccinia sorghi]
MVAARLILTEEGKRILGDNTTEHLATCLFRLFSHASCFLRIAKMPKSPSLQEIDSLPYHALQAEAAVSKHSVRRNLGAAKLREALKVLLGTNPDPSTLPQQWFIAAATAGPANPKTTAPAAPRPTKTNARIAAALNKASQNPPAPPANKAPPQRTRRPRAAAPSPDAPSARATQAPHPLPANASLRPHVPPTAAVPPPLPTSRRHVSNTLRPPPPRASASRLSQQQTLADIDDDDRTPRLIKAVLDEGRLRGVLVPPSTYNNHPGGPPPPTGGQALPDAIRQEAHRLGLPTSIINPTNIDFLCYLIRDTLQELNRGHFISCIIRASKKPIRQIPRPLSVSPTNPVQTTHYNNYGLAPSPVNPSVPWPSAPPVKSPPRPPTPGPSRSHPHRAPDASAPVPNPNPQSGVRGPTSSPVRQSPTRAPLSARSNSSRRLVSTPPSGRQDPPAILSPNLPLILSTDGQASTRARSMSDSDEEDPMDGFSDSSEEEVSRRFVEALLSGEQSLPNPSMLATPSQRKRDQVEDDSPETAPNKKAKRAQLPESSSHVAHPPRATNHDVPMATLDSDSSVPSQPAKPMKFFPSAQKAPARPQDTPSPPPSPVGVPSNPTLYGTEHHYGDTTGTRFTELLRGSTTLLPSPFNRKSKATNSKSLR